MIQNAKSLSHISYITDIIIGTAEFCLIIDYHFGKFIKKSLGSNLNQSRVNNLKVVSVEITDTVIYSTLSL